MQFELIPEPDADLRSPLKIFATPGGAEIRVVTIAGEPWFVAKDIAERLDYIWNGSTRIEHVPEEWRRVTSVVTLRGDAQEMAVLSEQGMYFFLARSDKPKALSFQKWIAGEVIPAIRKTGSYSVGPAFQIPTTLADALQLAADQARQIDTQAAALAIAAPKVAAQELLAGANGAFGLIEAGKQCGMGRDAFLSKNGSTKGISRSEPAQRCMKILTTPTSNHNSPRAGLPGSRRGSRRPILRCRFPRMTKTDRFVKLFGSWTYLAVYLGLCIVWLVANAFNLARIDPYPCQFLNLLLAILAGIQAPIILIAQSKQDEHRDALLKHLDEMEDRILERVEKLGER